MSAPARARLRYPRGMSPRVALALALAAGCGELGSPSSSASEGPAPGGPTSYPWTGGPAGASAGGTTGDPAGDPGDPRAPVYFAVIGDFGSDLPEEAAVAKLVAARSPAFVITLGDNNYYDGSPTTIDRNIGKHYHAFIAPYVGAYGAGAAENRFFPTLGNHDWGQGNLDAYTAYFALPGNERYYRLRRGPVELFALDSDPHEPDGISEESAQASWLEQALWSSDAPFKVVYMHHAPYSSGWHRGTTALRWPFAAWGADLVLAGHDHHYERLVVDDLLYVVNGSGGMYLRPLEAEEVGTQRASADVHGAMFVEADAERMTLSFVTPEGGLVDRVTILAEPPARWGSLVKQGAAWRFTQGVPEAGWMAPETQVAGWTSGPAPLGYGIGDEATTLPSGATTTYLRHSFLAPAEAVGAPLRLRIAADDGAVVYVNGSEVYRLNMPEGPIGRETPAATAVGWWYETKLAETIVPGAALQEGPNVLAVELHQQSAGSSDLRLELELDYGR